MMYDIPLEAWLEDHEDADEEAPCDLCLDTYGEIITEIDGIPVLLCEYCAA
ncbi:hypothetical protein ACFVH6_25865 [Spirillospora sp. NPDC127200]